jgi:hypothetical protein
VLRRRRGARAVFACGECVVPPGLSGALRGERGAFRVMPLFGAGRQIRYERYIQPTTRGDIVASLLDLCVTFLMPKSEKV